MTLQFFIRKHLQKWCHSSLKIKHSMNGNNSDTFFSSSIPAHYSNYIAGFMLKAEPDILMDWYFALNSTQSSVSVLNRHPCKIATSAWLHMEDNACLTSVTVTFYLPIKLSYADIMWNKQITLRKERENL